MRRAGWIVAMLAMAVLGGCGSDDNPTEPPIPTLKYDRTTPQNTLLAMQTAYVARDSLETKQVYDSSYVGASTNLSDPPGSQVSIFQYQDEFAHVATLARTLTIVAITLDLGPSSSWSRLPSDDPSHPEWAMIQISNFHGELVDGATLYSFTSTNPMTFAFIPTVAAPGDTTWKIIRWTEIGSGSGI